MSRNFASLAPIALFFSLLLSISESALGQCMLANPSFELGDSGAPVFAGWNQFGALGSSTVADHGLAAARVTGPNGEDWGTSGYWQRLDTNPGEQWEAAVRVFVDGGDPLTGQSTAMVNVEWRDAADALISYESHSAADANSPVETWLDFSVVSGPAPPEATTMRLLIGVLEAPSEAAPTVLYDTVTLYSLTSPTMDELQWNDFPGGRVIDFADRSWRVKGDGVYGPGPNNFSDDPDNVWVDTDGRLHLTIQQEGQTWFSTELALVEPLGYGDYVFTTVGRLDTFDPNAVLGFFLWQYGPCWDPGSLWWNPYNEIDIEFSRWGDPQNEYGHFTTQPWDWPGNGSSYDVPLAEGEITSHAYHWLPDGVEYRSWRGGAADESPETAIHSWSYVGPHTPRPEQPRVHLNFWHIFETPDSDQEAVLEDFNFVPEDNPSTVEQDPSLPVLPGPAGRLYPVRPNPFNDEADIRFALDQATETEISIFDLGGRRIRTLLRGLMSAGEHTSTWDGRDDSGVALTAGIYFYRIETNGYVETRKLTLMK